MIINLLIDNRWCERLKIKQGDKISVHSFCDLLRKKITNTREIYKENPKDLVLKREINLNKGLKKFVELNFNSMMNQKNINNKKV